MEEFSTLYSNTGLDVTNAASSFGFGFLGVFFATWGLVMLAIGIITLIAWWKIFEKAGKPGWASIVPIYNGIVLLQICGMSPWLVILFIIPFVNFIAAPIIYIVMSFKLAKVFGKDIGWGFGLLFLNTIFALILGFGDSKYVGEGNETATTSNVEVKEVPVEDKTEE